MCTKDNSARGASTELMPSIMVAFDTIIENTFNQKEEIRSSSPKKTHQSSNFANLSPGVQKLLSHVPEQEITRSFSSEETLGPRRTKNKSISRGPRPFHKSNESLEIISTNVQKMLSNLPDELVISTSNLHVMSDRKNVRSNVNSYLYSKRDVSVAKEVSLNIMDNCNDDDNNVSDNSSGKTFLYRINSARFSNASASSECDLTSAVETATDCDSGKQSKENGGSCPQKPLGCYLHTSPHGIASRTPVGRKHMGNYLQVPSESSVGTCTNSTASSSEVSRPVSLTSLGSCSSSGSSGPHHQSSTYLASAESLDVDSDPEPTGSQGSADSGIAEQASVSPEMRVLQEVLDTEAVYVSDLNEVIQGYLEAWREEEGCILADHLQDLFSNLVEIHVFNKSFLDQLRQAEFDPSRIANVFLQNDSGFSVYNEYCTNYPRTMDVLSQLTTDEKTASLFRERQMALRHALPLGSYLLKPVQRILKYHLLLQRLAKQCEPCHKPAVALALTTMTGVACGINNMKMKHEHAVRVQEIQSQLYGWTGPDLTALGELIAEGTFRMSGARGRRHVFLFDKVLLIAKSKQENGVAYKSHIMTSNLMLVEHVRGEPLSFQVLPFDNPRLACTLKARSPQHKREWTLQIKRIIMENYTAEIPSHARQLVLQLGQDIHETDDVADKWSPLKHHLTPHYLERRSRVRKSRDLSNRRATSQDRAFPSLGNWRRKSEPSMIPQYNTKTLPKKISKIKKAKESGSTFYTDLFDSETCNIQGESFESLPENEGDFKVSSDNVDDMKENKTPIVPDNIEKIVSDLLMENSEFQKVLYRQRRKLRDSEPDATIWLKEERPELPAKADSLPRSFQLNDQINSVEVGNETSKKEKDSVKENSEGKQEIDLSSQVADEHDYPEHKIYRNTGIRTSLLQRFRAMISEQQRKGSKYPLHKQGSKSMGEKLAHPDYVDPKKLFMNNSLSSSSLTITGGLEDRLYDFPDEPERLDMTINESEVLTEFEKRLQQSTNVCKSDQVERDTGQSNCSSSSHRLNDESDSTIKTNTIKSSQNSDSYYERLLDEKLVEEYVKDTSGKQILKQDSFKNSKSEEFTLTRKQVTYQELTKDVAKSDYEVSKSLTDTSVHIVTKVNSQKSESLVIEQENNYLESKNQPSPTVANNKAVLKRPTKVPPPVPVKPTRLINTNNINFNFDQHEIKPRDIGNISNHNMSHINAQHISTCNEAVNSVLINSTNSRSWVKAMVDRFE